MLDPGKKIQKINGKKIEKIKKKPLSDIIFCQNEMSQAEKEKKEILLPNSVHTRLGQENSEKNSKKIEKIKKPLSDIIFMQNGMRQAEKEKKNFTSEFRSIPTRTRKFRKKLQKN